MTAPPATAAHMHPDGLDECHAITSARELRLHLHYGHEDETSGLDHEALAERHRQAHAGDDDRCPHCSASTTGPGKPGVFCSNDWHSRRAFARGAALGEAFAGLGRKIPEGADDRRVGPSGQSSEGETPRRSGGHASPSGPDAAAQLAKAFVEAVRRLGNREISPAAVETVLAQDIRKALRSYR